MFEAAVAVSSGMFLGRVLVAEALRHWVDLRLYARRTLGTGDIVPSIRYRGKRGIHGMHLTIEIPDALEAALEAKAHAEGVTASRYAGQVLEQALSNGSNQARKPKKSAYGLLAKYGPGPTAEEIDENRREMFRGFG